MDVLTHSWFVFSALKLNRDTWANDEVAQTIKTNFIFWQVYDDTEEGSKKMHSWRGMVQPETLLEDLLRFMDSIPSDHHVSQSHKRPRENFRAPAPPLSVAAAENNDEDEEAELQRALAVSMENDKELVGGHLNEVNDANVEEKVQQSAYLPLPEEPKVDRSLLCRVGVRLPDGRRVQRNFLRTDPVQLLWSFCYSELKEDGMNPFRLTHAIPGASKSLDFNDNSTFEESGLGNSMVSVTWE
ncbi:UBX domain-containing protein 2 [Phtheirospermum japonicum]|uniref:UBX domain-containing protein 2 n=1 Tax=Phtheirospermum japonicum TaxID=374723 RepID=A0A830BFB1_9LAMI|nr:UBX domain-containing protein 2 [Phtheirospermum japonicum]